MADIYATEPENDEQIARCAKAWSELGTCRAVGMGLGPIPWTAIVMWAEFHGLDGEATQLLVDVIGYVENFRAERAARKRELEQIRGKR